METQEKLFNEFPPISTEVWEKLIKIDLKGEDYAQRLIWNTQEGIRVRPYYREEDLPKLDYSYLESLDLPYTKGNEEEINDWEIREDIMAKDVISANKKAIFSLLRGATSLYFDISEIEEDIAKEPLKFHQLLYDIYFDSISLNFKTHVKSKHILKLIEKEIIDKKIDAIKTTGSINFDPFNKLNLSGNFYESLNKDIELAKSLIDFSIKRLPGFRILGIQGKLFKDSGASVTQEVAFSLAIANEYLVLLTDKGLSVNDIVPRIQFNMGVGTNYFFEIAKFRAIRFLWSRIFEAFPEYETSAMKSYIHATTADLNKTIYDPYANILRTTSEAMAATLGGVDSLSVQPFDVCYQEPSRFSERVARNIQIILKREAYFNKVADPGFGSYYIENLTDAIVREAWKLFQNIEQKGGYIIAFMEGYIQKEIQLNCSQSIEQLAQGRDTLVGTNKYPKLDEKRIKDFKKEQKIRKTFNTKKIKLGKPLVPVRLSEAFEIMRSKTGSHGKVPKVFLFNYGDSTQSNERAIFSTNFFGCAGFHIIDNPPFNTVTEGIKKIDKEKPDIIVLCSSDEEYIRFAPSLIKHLNNEYIVAIAGYPEECIDELKEIGIRHFIHIKSNILETLSLFQDELGIK